MRNGFKNVGEGYHVTKRYEPVFTGLAIVKGWAFNKLSVPVKMMAASSGSIHSRMSM